MLREITNDELQLNEIQVIVEASPECFNRNLELKFSVSLTTEQKISGAFILNKPSITKIFYAEKMLSLKTLYKKPFNFSIARNSQNLKEN